MMPRVIACAGVLALGVAGCSGMNSTEQRTLSGGALGAGAGAALGAITGGSVVGGALIGGAAGAVGGYIYDREKRKE
ncbi:MAG TPA: YMGG-like glycine zipper-containing protein [Alphaproteobacteria bacterium]|nr:YMGG-like glycine zipper-containing protein [Alphaproteobacteria bacterium]